MKRIIYLALLLLYGASAVKIKAGDNTELDQFLYDKMSSFGSWLKDNNFDPSPATNGTIVLTSRAFDKVELDCETSHHFVSGHSEIGNYNITVDSSFLEHFVAFGQETHEPYEFQGYYNCTGAILASEYEGLDEDIQFSGNGNFTVTLNSSLEFIEVLNLGITEEYKFDFTHSWLYYGMLVSVKNVQLQGDWSEGFNSSKYFSDVEEEFGMIYDRFLLHDDEFVNPSSKLILQYSRQFLEEVQLTEIISDEANLPDPYNPTPSTTTTTTTTTDATTNTEETTSATPEQTTRSDGTNLRETITMAWAISMCAYIFRDFFWNLGFMND